MSTLAYIKFITDQDYSKGFSLLHERFTIAVENEVLCVPVDALQILDNNAVSYMIVNGNPTGHTRRRPWLFTTATQPVG